MANKTILLWDTDSKKPKNAWWSTGISNFNSVINSNNNLPANAVISKAVLKVYADFDGAGGLANVYMKYGFGGNESISTQLGGERKLTGNETNYDTDITNYMSSKVSPFAISTAYGSYFSANIYTSNIVVSALRMGKVELYVEYTIPTYTITVKANNDSYGSVTGSGTYNNKATATLTATPKTGYKFVQWNDGNTSATRTITVTGNATYTATFEKLKYTVTWKNNDGTVLETDNNVEYGTTPTYNGSTPKKTGYTFSGWSPAVGAISGNTTYTAQFTENKYTIAFNGNGNTGGSMSSITNVGYDDSKTLTANAFTKTGYTFNGWNTKADGSGTSYADKASVSKLTATNGATVTLYAKWKANSYTIKFNANGGSGSMSDLAMTYDTAKNLTANSFTRTGYDFLGWSKSSTATTATYADKASVNNLATSGTVTLYAVWKIKTFTVTWKNYDGTTLETDTNVAYGTTPAYNGATPTQASTAQHSYTFSGWSPAISAVTGNVTYTAQFTATVRKYTVKWYNYDGTLLETDTDVPYGTKPTYNGATPTKPSDDYYNYGFAGWSPSISEGIQGDKNFTAQFAQTDRYYTVRWVNASAVQGVEGALLETDEVKFNTQPDYNGATPKHPKQDTDPAFNYDFIGWSAKVTDPAKPDTELEKVKGDITYTAIYETTPKLYAITIILFNSQSTDIYEYGTELTIEAPEIVDFHRFVKWSDGDTRPSRTVQVTGEATYSAEYERIAIPIKANLEQITGCYLVPDTNTIVYIINGTVPTVKIGRESVDGWSFLVSNSVPENGYPLKKLFITENSGVTTRVY